MTANARPNPIALWAQAAREVAVRGIRGRGAHRAATLVRYRALLAKASEQ